MAMTGILFLEVCFWMEKDANIISMAQRTLGKFGKGFAWALYLFLFYCLTLAYIVGCGDLFSQLFNDKIPAWSGALLFVLLFAPLTLAGGRIISWVNALLVLGLAVSYFTFVYLGYADINPSRLIPQNWAISAFSLPIAFTAFAYQGIIPTLFGYMQRDVPRIRSAIWIGSAIPFVAYIIWQALIMGIVPAEGPGGLAETMREGQNAVYPLKTFLNNSSVYFVGQFFAFFALVTSFLGVTIGLQDFLADGLQIKKNIQGKILLCLLIFVPPLIFNFTHPGIFLLALDYAGGFGCALLLGLLPIMMVWSGRYRLGLTSPLALPGGKLLLGALALFVAFEVSCQLYISWQNF